MDPTADDDDEDGGGWNRPTLDLFLGAGGAARGGGAGNRNQSVGIHRSWCNGRPEKLTAIYNEFPRSNQTRTLFRR